MEEIPSTSKYRGAGFSHDKPVGYNGCEICATPFVDARDDRVACPGGHTCCAWCFRQYADQEIFGLGKSVLICMWWSCRQKYSDTTAQRVLGDKLMKRLRENRVTRCTCKCKNCDWKKKKSPVSKSDRKRLEREEHLTNEMIQRCPHCEKAILKDTGCNYMVCTSCETHFCYSCGKRLTPIDYAHQCFFGTEHADVIAGPAGLNRRAFARRWQMIDHAPAEIRPIEGRNIPAGAGANGFKTGVVWTGGLFRLAQMGLMHNDAETDSGGNTNTFDWRQPTLVEKRLEEAALLSRMFQFPPVDIDVKQKQM